MSMSAAPWVGRTVQGIFGTSILLELQRMVLDASKADRVLVGAMLRHTCVLRALSPLPLPEPVQPYFLSPSALNPTPLPVPHQIFEHFSKTFYASRVIFLGAWTRRKNSL